MKTQKCVTLSDVIIYDDDNIYIGIIDVRLIVIRTLSHSVQPIIDCASKFHLHDVLSDGRDLCLLRYEKQHDIHIPSYLGDQLIAFGVRDYRHGIH